MSTTGTALKKGADQALHRLLQSLAGAMAETLRTLADHPVQIIPGAPGVAATEALIGRLPGPVVVVRGTLDKDYAGHTLRIVFPVAEAATLSGYLMMTPEQVVAERRKKGTIESEDLEAFREVANTLCSCMEGVLRAHLGDGVGLRLQDHTLITPPADPDALLGNTDQLVLPFALTLAEHPAAPCLLAVDSAVAIRWNGKPLTAETEGATEESDEEIPQAPIRGKLAAYVCETETAHIVRRSCRRVGLEFDRRTRTEIPHPAAHKEQIVLIEIPAGEDKRFDWSKRLKSFHESIHVVLLLHYPSRQRVVQGFMTQADAILGVPVQEKLLSQKLTSILDSLVKPKAE